MSNRRNSSSRTVKPRPGGHPKANPHGKLEEVFPDIFVVKGSVELPMFGCLTMRFSRNMQILRSPSTRDLVLINTVRLNPEGLKELDQLGTVKYIFRVAGFHGKDDPFYKERYPDATVMSVEDAPYFPGFEANFKEVYFEADKPLLTSTKLPPLPAEQASLFIIESKNHPKMLFWYWNVPKGKY